MRTFTAEYPKKVNGCGLSQPNIPKKSTDADFHKRIKTVVPNFGNTSKWQKQTFPTLGAGKMLKNGCSQHWEQPFFSRCFGHAAYFMP